MIARVLFLVAAWLFVFIHLVSADWDHVAELWKGYEITPQQKDAIRRAALPGQTECCGPADGIPVEFDIKNDHYWANWDGGWREIPDSKVLKKLDHPVPFPILWVTKGNKFEQNGQGGFRDAGYRDVRCFWPGTTG